MSLIRTIVLRAYENKVVPSEGLLFVDLSEVGPAVYAVLDVRFCMVLFLRRSV